MSYTSMSGTLPTEIGLMGVLTEFRDYAAAWTSLTGTIPSEVRTPW